MSAKLEVRLPIAYLEGIAPEEEGAPGVRLALVALSGSLVFFSPEGELLEEVPSEGVLSVPLHVPIPDDSGGEELMVDLERWQRDHSAFSVVVERRGDLPEDAPYSRVTFEDASAYWNLTLAT